jgi:hypothetical protein
MASIESIGTSSEIKEQCGKYEKFGGGMFLFPPTFQREKEGNRIREILEVENERR